VPKKFLNQADVSGLRMSQIDLKVQDIAERGVRGLHQLNTPPQSLTRMVKLNKAVQVTSK
jgi:hypothetical protein